MMAKTKTTPRSSDTKAVTAAAKRPDSTKQFQADIDAVLSDFDDHISSMDHDVRNTAYKMFSKAYKKSLEAIWPKAGDASIDHLLESIHDTELKEYRRMTHLMTHQKTLPTVVSEPRTVPAPSNILCALVNRLPARKLPDRETCDLISTVF